MTIVKAHIRIAPDGTLSGKAAGLPAGDHEAEITLLDKGGKSRLDAAALLVRVRELQQEIARLPILDERSPDDIIGYNEHGHFD